jgi:hypothetical protein
MVHVLVGTGANATTLAAHEAILVKSPWFKEQLTSLTGQVNLSRKRQDIGQC